MERMNMYEFSQWCGKSKVKYFLYNDEMQVNDVFRNGKWLMHFQEILFMYAPNRIALKNGGGVFCINNVRTVTRLTEDVLGDDSNGKEIFLVNCYVHPKDNQKNFCITAFVGD